MDAFGVPPAFAGRDPTKLVNCWPAGSVRRDIPDAPGSGAVPEAMPMGGEGLGSLLDYGDDVAGRVAHLRLGDPLVVSAPHGGSGTGAVTPSRRWVETSSADIAFIYAS